MKNILMIFSMLLVSVAVFAVDSSKPASHNSNWERQHGQAAKANEANCLGCHEERAECIACHEDKAPRSHTSTFVNKTHGMEATWNKNSCQTCHRVDFCNTCHETAYPQSHTRVGFGDRSQNSANFHCNTGCVLPSGSWKNTPAKNCITCHQSRPILKTGVPHVMNGK